MLDDRIQLINSDGTTFSDQDPFDKVLVDAECTHDGSIKHILKFIERKNFDKKK